MEPEVRHTPIRYYEIDLLRFLAALSVVFFHYTYLSKTIPGSFFKSRFSELAPYSKYGYLGVELFFIISGYVVLLSAQGKTLRQFFLSRVTRLYPAFWAACTISFLLVRICALYEANHLPMLLQPSLGQYAFNLTMLSQFFGVDPIDGPYWSLTVEITFYFLISLLIAYRFMNYLDLCIAGWLACTVASMLAPTLAFATLNKGGFSFLFIPDYAPYFIAGMLFYLLQTPENRTQRRYLLLGMAYVLALWSGIKGSDWQSQLYHDIFSHIVVGVVITVFFLLFVLITFRLVSLSRFSWISWLGALTYPLYLLHQNIGFMMFHYAESHLNRYAVLSVVIGIMLAASYVVHVFVEKRSAKPLRNLVNRLLDSLKPSS